MKIAEIRTAFIDFFASKNHEVVPSSSLIPEDDPTLLFTNAGMVQFKEVFLGRDKRPYQRAVTSQRVVRAGGKHNDLENVGYTARHHTFFEMLGNFSFGDYFKPEAIAYAWEFLTQILKLPEEKLWVTVYKEDREAENIWLEKVGVSPERFSRLGDKDNFWSMGDTGPCGPCTEIFYDHGESVAGGPPGSPEEDGDRYIEIWNLVFMQYDRQPDGRLLDLPKPSVDTGMGLERIAAVMQKVHNNFEIDLFEAIIAGVASVVGTADLKHHSLRVIADHLRASVFLICDGVTPSNEGRGYVLRRIIRRALRHGNKLGAPDAFFSRCVFCLVDEMGEAYPELLKERGRVEQVLTHEESQFAVTLAQGLKILEQDIDRMQGVEISGQTLFLLYDTYGFPVDLTADIARERGLTLDLDGFEVAMQDQRQRSKQNSAFAAGYHNDLSLTEETEFTGYNLLSGKQSVLGLYRASGNGGAYDLVDALEEGDEGAMIFASTPFYAESGGQVGDRGQIVLDEAGEALFEVVATIKNNKAFLHQGRVRRGSFKLNQSVQLTVDHQERQASARNHSATHLLHASLRTILGEHVMQKGSSVDSEKLRFDFSHMQAVSSEELARIEQMVNAEIMKNSRVMTELMSLEAAKQLGALALFGEKYDENVRVLTMGQDRFSVELCGGTHVARLGEIGLFKILSETGVASGVRRIEAITGAASYAWVHNLEQRYLKLAHMLKTKPENLEERLAETLASQKSLTKELRALKSDLVNSASVELMDQVKDFYGVKVLFANLDELDAKSLRESVDRFKNKLGEGIVLIFSKCESDNQVRLAAGVTKTLSARVPAGQLVKYCAEQMGGKGGGRPDFAMAGGGQPDKRSSAHDAGLEWVESLLSKG